MILHSCIRGFLNNHIFATYFGFMKIFPVIAENWKMDGGVAFGGGVALVARTADTHRSAPTGPARSLSAKRWRRSPPSAMPPAFRPLNSMRRWRGGRRSPPPRPRSASARRPTGASGSGIPRPSISASVPFIRVTMPWPRNGSGTRTRRVD